MVVVAAGFNPADATPTPGRLRPAAAKEDDD